MTARSRTWRTSSLRAGLLRCDLDCAHAQPRSRQADAGTRHHRRRPAAASCSTPRRSPRCARRSRSALADAAPFDVDTAIRQRVRQCRCLPDHRRGEPGGGAAAARRSGFADVAVIGHWREARPTPRAFADRAGMLFLGAIHEQDSPNHDALEWFVREVLPLVEQSLGWETRLTVAGYVDPGDFAAGVSRPSAHHAARRGGRCRAALRRAPRFRRADALCGGRPLQGPRGRLVRAAGGGERHCCAGNWAGATAASCWRRIPPTRRSSPGGSSRCIAMRRSGRHCATPRWSACVRSMAARRIRSGGATGTGGMKL